MPSHTLIEAQLAVAEQLRVGRATMIEPQDLPGRYGRVVEALDRVLAAIDCPGLVGGGWAVWRHGYVGRVTQDIDIVLPADRLDDFVQAAAVSGFEVLPVSAGRWPKLMHKKTDIQVDIRPEGARPGTASHPAPTTIRAPAEMGATGASLRYLDLPALIELKLAAGRAQDEADVVQLVLANPDRVESVRGRLETIHPDYVVRYDALVQRAFEEGVR